MSCPPPRSRRRTAVALLAAFVASAAFGGLAASGLAGCTTAPTEAPARPVAAITRIPSATPTVTATPTITPTVPTATPTFTPTPPPEAFVQVVPAIDGAMKARLRDVLTLGQSRGLRPNVVAKVGDSITVSGFFLSDFGCGLANLGEYGDLAAVVGYFGAEPLPPWPNLARCEIHNSLTRRSLASGIGWTAIQVFVPFLSEEDRRATAEAAGTLSGTVAAGTIGETPAAGAISGTLAAGDPAATALPDAAPTPRPTPDCPPPDNTPLRCELRLIRPGVALVMFGTNEVANRLPPAQFKANIDRIAGDLLAEGVIPIVSTIPHRPFHFRANARLSPYNVAVMEVAAERQIPLVNFWRTLQGPDMVRGGMEPDGIHPNADGYGGALTERGLRYGQNQRNLAVLQTLDKLKRIVIEDGAPDG